MTNEEMKNKIIESLQEMYTEITAKYTKMKTRKENAMKADTLDPWTKDIFLRVLEINELIYLDSQDVLLKGIEKIKGFE